MDTSTGKVVSLEESLSPDNMACEISKLYVEWESYRQEKLAEWREIQRYVFATDTRKTTNSQLPWRNSTTIPKLCQIRDNLVANYTSALFPRRNFMRWEGDNEADDSADKKKAIEGYMQWVVDRPQFYAEVTKLATDYVDYGNVFAMPVWQDMRQELDDKTQVGFVGPAVRRISPLDIVFNPTAPSFIEAPKIIRSIVSLGEIKEMIERMSNEEQELKDLKELYAYMLETRKNVGDMAASVVEKDIIYQVAGFSSYRNYLASNNVEVLTFYGDIYDMETKQFKRNRVIKVVDRHKILSDEPNPSFFGHAPIYHVGWRIRPDLLYAMGPLDNLVGMQYRIDHLENLKADVFDLVALPLLKIKGYVEDFEWRPMERILVGDDGDVEVISPNVQALQANTEIAILEAKMEEMAGSPKEAMGFRTPGEKTAYEVQRLENAASRIFQAKIVQFERDLLEQLLNGMLELSRRMMGPTTIRVLNTDLKIASFETLTPEDLVGQGRLKPIAARHFAEKSQKVQDMNAFFGSAAGHDPMVLQHFSGIKLARLWEYILDLDNDHIVDENIRLIEQQQAQGIMQSAEQQQMLAQNTPSGLVPGDTD